MAAARIKEEPTVCILSAPAKKDTLLHINYSIERIFSQGDVAKNSPPPVNLAVYDRQSPVSRRLTCFWASYLVPFLGQEEITDISVLDPVSTHIELIEGNNVFGEVVSNA